MRSGSDEHLLEFIGSFPRLAWIRANQALDAALLEGERGPEDIIAEELRRGANALGRLTGRVDVEDILDVIFRDFCIGK